jgi:hypothetical protein
MNKRAQAAIKELEAMGYKIKPPPVVTTIKRTFEVQKDHLAAFEEVAARRKIKYKDAMSEMFGDWIKKWGGK